MRSTTETFDTPSPLSVRRARAKARERRTEYVARAYRCGDMAVRAGNAQDAQLLRAMTLVWQVLADQVLAAQILADQILADQILADQILADQVLAGKDAGVHNAADAPGPSSFAQIAPSGRGTI